MSINGDFSEFSLTEIIQYLHNRHKTGLLTLVGKTNHFLGLNKGYVVAATSRTDELGLYFLILGLSLIKKRSLQRVIDSAYDNSKPLGIFLHKNGFFSLNTLNKLLEFQVLRELHIIEHDAIIGFRFDKDVMIPNMELTGLSLPLDYFLCPNRYQADSTQDYISIQPTKKKSERSPITKISQSGASLAKTPEAPRHPDKAAMGMSPKRSVLGNQIA